MILLVALSYLLLLLLLDLLNFLVRIANDICTHLHLLHPHYKCSRGLSRLKNGRKRISKISDSIPTFPGAYPLGYAPPMFTVTPILNQRPAVTAATSTGERISAQGDDQHGPKLLLLHPHSAYVDRCF